MLSRHKRTLSILLSRLFVAGAFAQTPEEAVERLEAFLDRFPDRGPGFAVVVVTPEKTLLKYTDGVRRASTGEPMTNDTPIYIASQTKAYIGLLAARLHEENILSLDDKIVDYWPDVQFPDGVNASDYTLRDLLGHRVPIEVEFVAYMEAYVTELDPADYPALIAKHGSAREPGFRYDNIGYNIWAAILHKATGKSWQAWLDEKVFGPLDMQHTSSRTSDFPQDELSWQHIWLGKESGWHEVRPKTDAMMQSAGGLVTSVNDMAKWLRVQLKGDVFAGSGIRESTIELAQTPVSEVDPSDRNPYELPCSAYCLGWNICDFEGRELYIHGGGYTGARTMMAFSPEMGAGIAAFSNSDNMTGWLTSRTIIQFFQYLVDHETADRMADVRARVYPERIEELLSFRREQRDKNLQKPEWKGWSWSPSSDELREYTGKFHGDSKYQTVYVEMGTEELFISLGDLRERLMPATKDRFGGTTSPLFGPNVVQFERDASQQIVAVEFNGTRYAKRVPDNKTGSAN